jgi:hypothetical protein
VEDWEKDIVEVGDGNDDWESSIVEVDAPASAEAAPNASRISPEERAKQGTVAAVGGGFLQGAAGEYADEIGGALGAPFRKEFWTQGPGAGYRAERDELRELDAIRKQDNPNTYSGAKLAGFILGPGKLLKGVKGAKGLAAAGAGTGAVVGAGASEADLTKGEVGGLAADTAVAGTLGGALGGFAGAFPTIAAVSLGGGAAAFGDRVGMTPVERIAGLAGGGAAALGKGTTALRNVVAKRAAGRSERALEEALASYGTERQRVEGKLSEVLATAEARKGDLQHIAAAKKRAAEEAGISVKEMDELFKRAVADEQVNLQKGAEALRSKAAETKKTEAQVRREELEAAEAKLVVDRMKGVERAEKQLAAEKKIRLKERNQEYARARSGPEMAEFDADAKNQTLREALKEAADLKKASRAAAKAVQDTQKEMADLERSRKGRIGNYTQSDYTALDNIENRLRQDPGLWERLGQNEQRRIQEWRAGRDEWIKTRTAEPSAVEKADAEYAAALEALKSRMTAVPHAHGKKSPYADLSREEILDLVRAHGLKALPDFDPARLTDKNYRLPLADTLEQQRRTKLSMLARRLELDLPEDLNTWDPDAPFAALAKKPGAGILPTEAPARDVSGAGTAVGRHTKAAPKLTPQEPTPVVSEEMPREIGAAINPQLLQKFERARSRASENLDDLTSLRQMLSRAAELEAKAKSDLANSPDFAKQRSSLDANRRKYENLLNLAKQAEERAVDPNKDPKYATQTRGAEQLKGDLNRLTAESTPEAVIERGKKNLQLHRDREPFGAQSLGDIPRKALNHAMGLFGAHIPNAKAMNDPAARAAYFKGVGDWLAKEPNARKWVEPFTFAVLNAGTPEGAVVAEQLLKIPEVLSALQANTPR